MIYILLGMHKSGTTLLSQILHESKIPMGNFDQTKGYDQGNKYERLETHDLNIEMLGYDYTEFSLNIARVIKLKDVKPEILAKVKSFAAELESQNQDWGFKDPRTCLTYEIWKDAIPSHRLLAIFRHPSELWSHYRKGKFLHFFKNLSRCWKSTNAWYVYNREVLNILKSRKEDYFLAEYHDFMTDDKIFKNFETFIGKPLKDSRNSGLYRSKKKSDPLFTLTLWLQKHFFSRNIPALYDEMSAFAGR